MGDSTTYYIKLGAGVGGAVVPFKYAFRAPENAYKGLESQLGVVRAKEAEGGLVYGANSPKPARIRINFEGGGSTTRFCDPGKLEGVTIGGKLNRKTVNISDRFRNKKISSVTAVQG